MSVIVVTGTGTGVGKTVVTAALAAMARARASTVAVVKPAQTGTGPAEPGDLAVVAALAGLPPPDAGDAGATCWEFARYPHPLSPAAAARHSGRAPLDLADAARRITELADTHRLVLVEGAGGLLVRYGDGTTIADLARELGASVLVVTEAALGTLNATALTFEAMAHRGLTPAGLVIGSWPAEPDLAACSNVPDLEAVTGIPLSGALPEGAGGADPASFLTMAAAGLAPALGGRFDAADFRQAAATRLRELLARGGPDTPGGR